MGQLCRQKMTMKKIALCVAVFACFTAQQLRAQSFKAGTIAADLGVGFKFYGVRAHSPANGTDVTGIFLGGAVPTITAEYGVLNFLGVGARYSRGSYLQQGYKVRTNDIGVNVNIHVANKKDKFDLPITLGYGFGKFKADETVSSGTGSYIHAKGGVIGLHIAPHFYFSKYVGMFVRLGYNKYLYNNIEIVDGPKTFDRGDGATWKMGGVEFNIGVAGKF